MKFTSGIESLRLPETNQAARNSIYLHPGQTQVSLAPAAITTIVGSCVAMMLWDPRFCVGGATHFLLPHWDGHGQPSPRYGDVALEGLLQDMKKAGARIHELRAFMYGGGSVLAKMEGPMGGLGLRNVDAATQWLRTHPEIQLMEKFTGGNKGRKIIFDTFNGSAKWNEI